MGRSLQNQMDVSKIPQMGKDFTFGRIENLTKLDLISIISSFEKCLNVFYDT